MMSEATKNNFGHLGLICFIFILIMAWIFSGWPQISNFPPKVKDVRANTTNIVVTSCYINDVDDSTCYNAIFADGGTSDTLATKTEHLDAQFQTLEASSVNSATLYYDSWGAMAVDEDWWIYVKASRDGETICSVNPAPENAEETTDNVSCPVTAAQLSAGVWLYIAGNDAKGPNYNNIDYVRLYVDYNPAPVVSVSVSTTTIAYGMVDLSATSSTIANGDTLTVTNDGNVTEDFTIRGYDTAVWTLANSIGNNDEYKHEFSTTTGNSWTALATSSQSMIQGIVQNATTSLDLMITAPSNTSTSTEQNANIMIQATQTL